MSPYFFLFTIKDKINIFIKKMIMKNFVDFLKKYKVHILSTLCFIFIFRSCIKSSQINRLEKEQGKCEHTVDSLNNLLNKQKDTINNIGEVIRLEKIKVHSEYDDYISSKDRGQQLMELHMLVKQNIQKLQK